MRMSPSQLRLEPPRVNAKVQLPAPPTVLSPIATPSELPAVSELARRLPVFPEKDKVVPTSAKHPPTIKLLALMLVVSVNGVDDPVFDVPVASLETPEYSAIARPTNSEALEEKCAVIEVIADAPTQYHRESTMPMMLPLCIHVLPAESVILVTV